MKSTRIEAGLSIGQTRDSLTDLPTRVYGEAEMTHMSRIGKVFGRVVRQRGQAILWFLATVGACAVTMVGVYNVTQMTSEKQKAVNAADAGAYAGALVEARTLNFIAYSNRLMVTSEVLVAQAVSLDAWVRFVDKTIDNISIITDFIPYLGEVILEIKTAIDEVTQVVDDIPSVVIKYETGVRDVYAASMKVVVLGTPLEAQLAARSVVAKNQVNFNGHVDTPATVPLGVEAYSFARNQIDWLNFVQAYTGNQRSYARDVILASRDAFSNNPCSNSPNCRGGNDLTNVNIFGVTGFEENGGTTLVNFDRWEAQNTLEQWNCFFCKKKSYLPVGWGRATAANSATAGNVWAPNRLAQDLAVSDNPATYGGWQGIPDLYDLTYLPKPGPYHPANTTAANEQLGFAMIVAKGKANLALAENFKIASNPTPSTLGSPDMRARLAADQILAVGRARVFFERPKRNTKDWTATALFRDPDINGRNVKEYGSLYNPYWQVRLDTPLMADKIAAAGFSGVVPVGVLETQ